MITIVKDNGELVGCDENLVLYNGQRVQVGMDEMTVTTVIADDGLSFERTTHYGDNIIAKGTTTKEGFVVGAGLLGVDDDQIEARWEAECAIDRHGKVYADVIIDGELTTVEKKWTFTDWTER